MSWTFLSDREAIARKKHACIWCQEPILPGERYQIQTEEQ